MIGCVIEHGKNVRGCAGRRGEGECQIRVAVYLGWAGICKKQWRDCGAPVKNFAGLATKSRERGGGNGEEREGVKYPRDSDESGRVSPGIKRGRDSLRGIVSGEIFGRRIVMTGASHCQREREKKGGYQFG
jgi:hypothetical protein